MIISTRQGCSRAALQSCLSAVLPTTHLGAAPIAESSRQALDRARYLQGQARTYASFHRTDIKGKGISIDTFSRRYATAVAVHNEDVEDESPDLRRPDEELEKEEKALGRQWPVEAGFPFHPRPPLQANVISSGNGVVGQVELPVKPPSKKENPINQFPLDDRLWDEEWRRILQTAPIYAFLCLHTMEKDLWRRLDHQRIDDLLCQLEEQSTTTRRFGIKASVQTVTSIMKAIRQHLLSLSTSGFENEQYVGTHLRGERLRRFMTVCVMLNCQTYAVKTFIKLLPGQINRGEADIQEVTRFIRWLSEHEQWDLVTDCMTNQTFPFQTRPNIPFALWTPELFRLVADAFHALRNPGPVMLMGQLYEKAHGSMNLDVYSAMLRSAVHSRDQDAVRRLRQDIRDNFGTESQVQVAEQTAILEGQRSHGVDISLEEQVLAGLPSHPEEDGAELLHHLIRLRLGSHDLTGARSLLGRFDLEGQPRLGALRPTPTTILLAFEIVSRQPDRRQLEAWWSYFMEHPTSLRGDVIVLLVKTMAAVGLLDEAYEMIRGALFNFAPLSRTWRLPIPTPIDHDIANMLTQCMAQAYGLKGLQKATDLMRHADIAPDGRTLQTVLDAVRNNMATNPYDLGRLLNVMLERVTNVRAQVGHVDAMLAEAVKLAAQRRSQQLSLDKAGNIDDPIAGLVPVDRFAEASENILQSLRDRSVPPTSKSIALRLRFEAMIGQASNGVPTAQSVWNEYTAAGYWLNRRHLLALMQGYVDAGQMDQAEDVIQLAKEMRVKPTRGMYMTLIVGWGNARDARKARAAYEAIREAGRHDREHGLDIVAVTAMIQAYLRSMLHGPATEITLRDLMPFAEKNQLDDQAIIIGMSALRWTSDEAGAVDFLARRDTPKLNFFLRECVAKIRTHLERKVLQGRATPLDRKTLSRVEDILRADVQARPYIRKGSLFTKPSNDRVPRWYNKHNLLPRFSTSEQTSWIADMIAPAIGTDTDTLKAPTELVDDGEKLKQVLVDHRRKLELELISLRPGGNAAQTDDQSIDLTLNEQRLVDREMTLFQKRLVPDRPKSTAPHPPATRTGKWHKKKARAKPANVVGRLETEMASQTAAAKRLSRQKESSIRASSRDWNLGRRGGPDED